MSDADRFVDTNVLLYLLSADAAKADRAEAALSEGGVVSVQVLNEFASVASRKLGMTIAETREALAVVRALCRTVPLTEGTHDKGLEIAERYGLAVYDAMIVAAALLAGCDTLYSEDLQDGQRLDGRLTVRNPLAAGAARGGAPRARRVRSYGMSWAMRWPGRSRAVKDWRSSKAPLNREDTKVAPPSGNECARGRRLVG